MPQYHVRLTLLVGDSVQREELAISHSVLAKSTLALKHFDTIFASPASAPLDYVDYVDMGVSDDLNSNFVKSLGC